MNKVIPLSTVITKAITEQELEDNRRHLRQEKETRKRRNYRLSN